MPANPLVPVVAVTALMAVAAARPLLNFRRGQHPRRQELEAAKRDAYQQIRAAQLDWRLGKLSDADFEVLHGQLSEQAITILKQIDDLDR